MNILPIEMLHEIFKFLDYNELLNISLLNIKFYRIIQDDYFWKNCLDNFISFYGIDKSNIIYGLGTKSNFIRLYQLVNMYKKCRNGSLQYFINRKTKELDGGEIFLRNIQISANEICKLVQLKKIQSLRIEHCNLTTELIDFCKLTKLIKLNLSYNEICVIPKEISNLVNLEILTLSYNKIRIVPIAVCNLKLKSLSIDNNLVIHVPKEIYKCKNLHYINLYDNPNDYSYLASEIFRLQKFYINMKSKMINYN